MKYYQIRGDAGGPDCWHLTSPTDANGRLLEDWEFSMSRHVEVATPLTITISIYSFGPRPLDWSFSTFDMPVVAKKVGNAVKEFACDTIELFPAKVTGHLADYYILNTLACPKCLDESRSEFLRWLPEDNRPDKEGKYKQVTKLFIKPEAVEGLHIFRIWGWEFVIISEILKQKLDELKVTGVSYKLVT
jgi:hypothetical protein